MNSEKIGIETEWKERSEIALRMLTKHLNISTSSFIDLGSGADLLFGKDECKMLVTVDVDPNVKPDSHRHITADIDGKEIPSSGFDCVLMLQTLEHLRFPFKTIGKISAAGKPGQKIIITVPNIVSFKNRLRVMLGKYPKNCAYADIEHLWETKFDYFDSHLSDWSPSVLTQVCRANGIKTLEVKTKGETIYFVGEKE